MILIAKIFRAFFHFPFFRRYYFGLYTKVFKPRGWFKGKMVTQGYRGDLKIHLELDDWIQQQIFFFGDHDQRGIIFTENYLKRGGVFIDIGANIGCYSLAGAQAVGSHGKVFAFEPVSHVYDLLKANISLNELKHVEAECLAVMDKNEYISLHVSGKDNQGMSSMYRHDAESGRTEQVKGIRLDDFLAARFVERLDLIKMDIEGAEIFALRGMIETLRNLRPVLILEVVDTDSKDGKEIFCLLAELNYLAYSLSQQGALMPFKKYETKEAYYNYVFIPVDKLN